MNHLPEGARRLHQVDQWNGEGAENHRSHHPTMTVPSALAREVVNDKRRRQERHKKQKRSHRGLLLRLKIPDRVMPRGKLCKATGWLWKHESGTYVKFTQAGADLFA
jgi:hypothetical protein